jgi:hypothetical protein
MKTRNRSLEIRVASATSPAGTTWCVDVADESQAVFTGDGAKGRAIEAALRLAEDLRTSGPVLVVVGPSDGSERVSRVLRGRLAS